MKRIRVTDYCLSRISARRLDVNFVEEVIRSPEQIVPDEDDPSRRIYQSRFVDMKGKTKLLRVVVEENKDENFRNHCVSCFAVRALLERRTMKLTYDKESDPLLHVLTKKSNGGNRPTLTVDRNPSA